MEKLTNIIESILFIAGDAVEIGAICEKFGVSDTEMADSIANLKKKYSGESGIQLLEFNRKLQFSSNSEYVTQVESVLNPIREKELSKSLLEVSAIIAYKQPITRTEIEEIRGGVSCDYAMAKLSELKIIEPVGRKDAVGKPILYGTTDEFLKRFQIPSLDALPDYEQLLSKIALLKPNKTNDLYNSNRDIGAINADIADRPISENPYEQTIAESNVKVAAKTFEEERNGSISEGNEDKKLSKNNSSLTSDDDFEVLDDEDELPDFLKGEDIIKVE